jgi:hypothetical protein
MHEGRRPPSASLEEAFERLAEAMGRELGAPRSDCPERVASAADGKPPMPTLPDPLGSRRGAPGPPGRAGAVVTPVPLTRISRAMDRDFADAVINLPYGEIPST